MAIKTFSVGEVLTASDTNTFLANAGLVQIVSGVTVTSTGGTSATVSNGTVTVGAGNTSVTVTAFSSTYDVYRVIMTGGVGGGTTNIAMTLGGVAAGYYGSMFGSTWAAGAFAGAGVNNAASWTNAGFCTTGYALLDATIYNPTLARNKFISCAWTYNNAGAAYSSFLGELVSTANLTSFTLTPAASTLTGGTITVYGFRKV